MTDIFVARSIDEVRFWARIMKEHSLLLKLGLRCSDTELIEEADHYYEIFEEIERKAYNFDITSTTEQIKRFNQETAVQVEYIWAFKRKILDLVFTGQLLGTNYLPLFVDHICREAVYFKNRLDKLNSGYIDPLPNAIINEHVFFLKIMADNAKLICHLLDPSESKIIEQAKTFCDDFDLLLFQAMDFEHKTVQLHNVSLLDQFLNQSCRSVKSLRDFKKTLLDLILQSRIKSNIHAILADQVFREAERFLFIIEEFDNNLKMTEQ